MSDFFNYLYNNNSLEYIPAPNEGDAVAFACGAYIANNKSVVVFQNSGLGNAVNPLTSLASIYNTPFIGIVSLRGDPNGDKDEPQHQLMGAITTQLLDTMNIKWDYFPYDDKELQDLISNIDTYIDTNKNPYFLVLRKNTVNKYQNNLNQSKNQTNISDLSRYEALNIIQKNINNNIILTTTGKSGRELYTLEDRNNQIYMVGSMGCALSLGLGLSTNNKNKKIYIIDGDGALLMRMGNMAFAGQQNPSNLVHILLDNNVHDSTGGQISNSNRIDFCKIAKACSYTNIYELNTKEDLNIILNNLENQNSLSFIRVHIKPGIYR